MNYFRLAVFVIVFLFAVMGVLLFIITTHSFVIYGKLPLKEGVTPTVAVLIYGVSAISIIIFWIWIWKWEEK